MGESSVTAVCWAVGVIFLVLLDLDGFAYYDTLARITNGLQNEFHCNTKKLEELGFTKWALIWSYLFVVVLILILLGLLAIVIFKMIKAKSVDAGTQADLDFDPYALESHEEYKQMNISTFDDFELEKDSADSVQVKTLDDKAKTKRTWYTSQIFWDLTVSKNRAKRLAVTQSAMSCDVTCNQKFTTYIFIYVHDPSIDFLSLPYGNANENQSKD